MIEIIQHGGLEIFLSQSDVIAGDSCLSQTEPGLWFGVLVTGKLHTTQPLLGSNDWTKCSALHFWIPIPSQTNHIALEDGVISSVFIRIRPEDIAGIMAIEDADMLKKCVDEIEITGPVLEHLNAQAWKMLCCMKQGTARKFSMASGANAIISSIIENIGKAQTSQENDAHSFNYSTADAERAHKAKNILLSNLSHTPSLPELAREVGLNTRKLTELFTELFNVTPYAFIKERRLNTALSLLAQGTDTIGDIAQRVGYKPAHFSTEFRRRFGSSPSNFVAPKVSSASPKTKIQNWTNDY